LGRAVCNYAAQWHNQPSYFPGEYVEMKIKKLLSVLITALATLLVIAVSLYQCFEGGVPPVADAPTVTVPAVGATPSSMSKAPVTPPRGPHPRPTR
jgi:hypothetical protein